MVLAVFCSSAHVCARSLLLDARAYARSFPRVRICGCARLRCLGRKYAGLYTPELGLKCIFARKSTIFWLNFV